MSELKFLIICPFLERGVKLETFLNIPGSTLGSLLQSAKFKSNTPDSTKTFPSLVSQINVADNYGVRMTTFYVVCIIELKWGCMWSTDVVLRS